MSTTSLLPRLVGTVCTVTLKSDDVWEGLLTAVTPGDFTLKACLHIWGPGLSLDDIVSVTNERVFLLSDLAVISTVQDKLNHKFLTDQEIGSKEAPRQSALESLAPWKPEDDEDDEVPGFGALDDVAPVRNWNQFQDNSAAFKMEVPEFDELTYSSPYQRPSNPTQEQMEMADKAHQRLVELARVSDVAMDRRVKKGDDEEDLYSMVFREGHQPASTAKKLPASSGGATSLPKAPAIGAVSSSSAASSAPAFSVTPSATPTAASPANFASAPDASAPAPAVPASQTSEAPAAGAGTSTETKEKQKLSLTAKAFTPVIPVSTVAPHPGAAPRGYVMPYYTSPPHHWGIPYMPHPYPPHGINST